MNYWYYIVIVAFAIAMFIAWKEWQRVNRARLALRLIASVLAVLCVVLLSYPEKKEQQQSSAKKLIVLTDGFNIDSVTYFTGSNKNLTAFSADYSLVKSFPKQKIKWIPDLNEFFTLHAKDSMYVFGNGFTKEELNLLHDHSFIFKAALIKPSVSSIYWNKELKAGAPLVVQGKYDNTSGTDVKIQLLAFGEGCDSTIIKPGTHSEFSLTTVPKHRGNAVYTLLALSGKDTLQHEPLPVEVENKPPLKILILSSSPDFEKTFLKNRLAQSGYEITMKTAISKNKSDEQFVNMSKAAIGQLSSSYPDNFDVLIADDRYLAQLSPGAADAIRSAIEHKGIGLITKLSDEKNSLSLYSQKLSTVQLKQDKKPFVLIHPALHDSDIYKLRTDEQLCLRYQNGVQPLLQDNESNVYAANFIYGEGKVVATTLDNTYTLALSGNNKAWQSLWSLLLDNAAKKTIPDETWITGSEFSYVDEPASIILESGITSAPLGLIENNKISMVQNPLLPYQLQGTYWPRQHGWQTLIEHDGNIKNWYAYNRENWKSLRDYTKIKTSLQYIAHHPASFLSQSEGDNNKLTSDTKLYLVILFFICCGFLWIEQKLS